MHSNPRSFSPCLQARFALMVSLLLPIFMLATTSALRAQAEGPVAQRSPWQVSLSAGPSLFRGDEANTVGHQWGLAILRNLGRSATWVRAESMVHYYGVQSVYPCLISVSSTCFPLSQRSVAMVGLGVQHFLGTHTDRTTSRGYLMGGVATFISERTASAPPSCSPGSFCPKEATALLLTDIDYGVHAGVGYQWTLGRKEIFLESRLLKPLLLQNGASPLTRFRITPVSAGVRF